MLRIGSYRKQVGHKTSITVLSVALTPVLNTGQVWEFVCKIGNQIKKFVMDCVEKICEAASWVRNDIATAQSRNH